MPRRAYTEPISSPITPPPMTINFLGTFSKANAPVEETNIFSSNGNPGNGVGSEPVAIRTFLALRVLTDPSAPLTLTVPVELLILPHPLT